MSHICKREALILLTIAFLTDFKVVTSACESGWLQHENYCYFLAAETQSWQNAKQGCWNKLSLLVTVLSESEQLFIEASTADDYWLGLKGNVDDGLFTWIHGKEADTYTHFSPLVDSWTGSSSVCVYIDSTGFWRLSECSSPKQFICKTPDCSDGVKLNVNVDARGDCLIFQQDALSWQESRTQCQSLYGDTDLASPTNNEFKNFVQNNYANHVDMRDFWLGMEYDTASRTLSLVSEQTTDWSADDRDSSGGQCIAWLDQQKHGERDDCTRQLKSLCQRSIYYYNGDEGLPTTLAPTTNAPTTDTPTVAPSTAAPTTDTPTMAPTTAAPTTAAPTTDTPTMAPTTAAPTTDMPTVAQTTKHPTTDSLTTSYTTPTNAPTTDAPTLAPATNAPTTDTPTLAPATDAPTTDTPTLAPATDSPTTDTIISSTTSPTTAAANNEAQTTAAKTTVLQTMGTPTTIEDELDRINHNLASSADDTVLHTTEDWLLDHDTIPNDVTDRRSYTQKYLSACSDIMDDVNHAHWRAKPGGASDLIDVCSSVVDDLAKSSDTDVTITKTNLVAKIKIFPQASSFDDIRVDPTASSQAVITKEDFLKLGIADDKKVSASITMYTNGQHISGREEGRNADFPVSGVIAITMLTERDKISMPVRFTLKFDMVMNPTAGEEPTCVYQKKHGHGNIIWDNGGCRKTKSTKATVTCSCNHTTNFAILMQVTDVKISKKDEMALNWITYVCCSFSIVALLITLVVLLSLRSLLRSDRVTIHVNLVIALIWAQTLLLLSTPAAATEALCRAVAIMLHYFFLAVFCWMLVEGAHLYLQIVRVFSAGKDRLIPYLLVGWGSPVILVAITAGVRWNEYGDNGRCWLSTAYGMVWAFVGPALLIIMINFVILIMVLRILIISAKSKSDGDYDHVKAGLKGAVLLLPLLGITWLFGVISVSAHTVVFLYLFSIFNSLQGVFIFLIYIVFNGEVRNAIIRRKEKRALTRGDFTSTVDSTSDSKIKSNVNRVYPDSETKDTQMVDIHSTSTTQTHTQMTFRKQPGNADFPEMGGTISSVN